MPFGLHIVDNGSMEAWKLGHILGELNFRPFFEQVTSSRSSGESLGTDLPPAPQVIKGPKSAGFYRVNMRKLNL